MRPHTDQILTADRASDLARRAVHHFTRAGLSDGDRVAIVTPEHRFSRGVSARLQSLTIAISWGCLRAGFVPVMVNPLLTERERAAVLADAGPVATLIGQAEFESVVEAPVPIGFDLSDVPLGRPMHYTSGTTGAPKGVWTHALSRAESAALWAEEQELWRFESADRYLLHGPLCHSAPLRFAHATLAAGGTVITQGWFDAEANAEALTQHKPTVAFAVPTQLDRLLTVDPPASPYRLLAHAGSACPADLKHRIHDWAGPARVYEFYGSTEGQFTACSGPEWLERPGTVGRARTGRRLRIDEGTIWCDTPAYARFAYWQAPDKTARTTRTVGDRFSFTVGDMGRLDTDGYLYIDGRREDLIITGGVNVYPAEVEPVLESIDGVSEAAVFGTDDPHWGQRVTAAYTGSATPEQVRERARARLAGHKCPKVFHKVDELPRTASGKIQRQRLRGPMQA